MNLLDFFSREAGQQRRKWLDETVGGAIDYITPPNLRPAVNFAAQMNPIQGMGDAMQAGEVLFSPEATAEARKRAALDMGIEIAMAATPAALAKMGYMAAPQALAETFAMTGDALAERGRGLLSDAQYAGRSIAQGDPKGVLEAFQRGGTPQSVGAEAANDDALSYYIKQRSALMEREKLRGQVEMYSPSLRAAENLKQNRGTYEQLRKMMIDGGAKADELSWSGADSKFKGKKVTKQEIEDYLRNNTDMITQNTLEATGKLGETTQMDANALVNEYVDRALQGEIEYYYNEIMPDMVDELGTYVRVSNADPDILEETARRRGITVDELLDLHDDEYIDLENSLRLKRFDEVVDANFNLRDMARESLYEDAIYEASRDPEQFMIDYLNIDPDEMGNVGDTEYSKYFTQGAKDYKEKIFTYDDPTKLLDEGLFPNAGHFNDQFDRIVGHSRTGEFPLSHQQGNALLVGELQSDVGQDIRKLAQNPRTFEEMLAKTQYRQAIDEPTKILNEKTWNAQEAVHNVDEFEKIRLLGQADLNAYNKHLKEKNEWVSGLLQANDPTRNVPLKQFSRVTDMSEGEYAMFDEWARANRGRGPSRRLKRIMPSDIQQLRSDLLQGNLSYEDLPPSVRGPMREYEDAANEHMFAKFTARNLEDISNRVDPETGIPTEKMTSSLPYVDKTPKWVDMMLRRNIFDAIKEGNPVIATPNSGMVRDMTYGTPEGQGEFYDKIVPRRLQDVARRIDPNAKVEPMSIQTDSGQQDVFGLRLNDEFIRNAAEKGIPTWMIAGGVGLGGIMEYLKEKREEPKYGPRRSLLEM